MPTSLRAVRDRVIQFPHGYRLKEALASLLIATPLLVIFFDNAVSPSQWITLPIAGTLLILATIPHKLRRFHRLEFALPLFFPSIVVAVLCSFIFFLQSWKEAKLARHQTDETRSALVATLGLRPAGDRQVTLTPLWGIAGVFLFWVEALLAHTLPVPTQAVAWIPFLAFSAGLVTMLTSLHGVVKPGRTTQGKRSWNPTTQDTP
jgi:hypothetical protein